MGAAPSTWTRERRRPPATPREGTRTEPELSGQFRCFLCPARLAGLRVPSVRSSRPPHQPRGGPSPPCSPARPRGCYPDEPRPANPGTLTARAPEPESANSRPSPLHHARHSPFASTSPSVTCPARSPRPLCVRPAHRRCRPGAVPSLLSYAPGTTAGLAFLSPALPPFSVGMLGRFASAYCDQGLRLHAVLGTHCWGRTVTAPARDAKLQVTEAIRPVDPRRPYSSALRGLDRPHSTCGKPGAQTRGYPDNQRASRAAYGAPGLPRAAPEVREHFRRPSPRR